jgi:hypothetical protein
MGAIVQERRMSGASMFAVALLLLTPTVVAFFASSAIVHDADFPASALWLMYEVSLYIGCVGIAIDAGLTISAAVGHRISRVFVWLMAISAAGGASLLWYAAHIYRSPGSF